MKRLSVEQSACKPFEVAGMLKLHGWHGCVRAFAFRWSLMPGQVADGHYLPGRQLLNEVSFWMRRELGFLKGLGMDVFIGHDIVIWTSRRPYQAALQLVDRHLDRFSLINKVRLQQAFVSVCHPPENDKLWMNSMCIVSQ
eukprot:2642895-Amphidinium_carterae.1